MTDVTHECPAPGCERRVQPQTFACKPHWFTLPAELRNDLWRWYRRAPFEQRYWEARARCLAHLGVPTEAIAEMNAGVGVPAGG